VSGVNACRKLAAGVIAALAVCAPASAAKAQWVTLTDKYEGFSLTVPKSMYFVPNSVAKVKTIVKQLTQQNQAGAAAVYTQILAGGSKDITPFVYQGFFLTPSASVQPLFTLAAATTPKTNTTAAGLTRIAASSAAALRAKNGATILAAKLVTLPAGPAALVEASEVSGGVKTLLVVYTIGDGSRIYQLTFRTDAATKASLATFDTIAKRFGFA
jgi:hypothetical protein